MNVVNAKSVINFQGRATNLKDAEKICRKIQDNFSAVSPWKADFEAFKRGVVNENDTAVPWSTIKLNIFRDIQENALAKKHWKYAACIIDGIKHFKVANCKEFAELASIIGKLNGVKNSFCGNLYLKNIKNKRFQDVEHCVYVINPNIKTDKINFADTYYDSEPNIKDLCCPDKKAIAIDVLFGIVDYWQNLKTHYINLGLINPTKEESLSLYLKKDILPSESDLKKLRKFYPDLLFDSEIKSSKSINDFRDSDQLLKYLKISIDKK